MPALWSVGVGLAAFALYLWLAPPVSGDQDTSELTLALATAGVPHPTGYPLYILCGHAFAVLLHVAGAPWQYAANAWSGLGGGAAVGLLHATAARLVPPSASIGRLGRFTLALVPSGLLAINPLWAIFTALAEVHSWHLAWVGGACLLFVELVRRMEPSSGPLTNREAKLSAAAWGCACGLGLAHHLTSVLIFTPLSVALAIAWRRQRSLHIRELSIAAAAALLPLLSYAFIAYRAFHPAAYHWPELEPSWRGVLAHVTGAGYGGFLGHFIPAVTQQRFLVSYVAPVLAPALVGLILVALRARRSFSHVVWWGFLAALLVQLGFAFEYGVPDPAVYFLPAIWLALVSVAPLLAMVSPQGGLRSLVSGAALVGLALLAGPWLQVAIERRDGFIVVGRHLRQLWLSIPDERAIVLWPSDMYTRFVEFQVLDREKPQVFVISHNLLTQDRPRRDFERRFGIDPMAGMTIRDDSDVLRIATNVNRQTSLPVFELDAPGLTMRQLPKTGPASP